MPSLGWTFLTRTMTNHLTSLRDLGAAALHDECLTLPPEIGTAMTRSPELPTGWHPMTTRPLDKTKVNALYDDGSGGEPIYVHAHGRSTSTAWKRGPWSAKHYSAWAYLPKDHRFPCEDDPSEGTLPAAHYAENTTS